MPAKDSTRPASVSVPRIGYFANRDAKSRQPYKAIIPKCPTLELDEVFQNGFKVPKTTYREHIVEALVCMLLAERPLQVPDRSPICHWMWANGLVRPIHLNATDCFVYLEFCVTAKGKRWLRNNQEIARQCVAPRIERVERELELLAAVGA